MGFKNIAYASAQFICFISLCLSCSSADVVQIDEIDIIPDKPVVVNPAPVSERPIDVSPNDWVLDAKISDEFNSTTINTTIWDNNPADWGPWSWEPDNTYQTDNELKIRMRYEEHSRSGMDLFYKSGIVRSRDTITYGYVEAKIKGIHTYPGASPAFWLYSLGGELDGWGIRKNTEGAIRYCEVDVVEMLQGNFTGGKLNGPEIIDSNLHTVVIENGAELWKRPGGYPELTKTELEMPWDPRDEYHTYGALIAKDKITFYIDGKKTGEKSNVYWHLPMHVTLSLGLRWPHVSYNCASGVERCPVPEKATKEGFPTEMKVDWVRCYRKKK